MKNINSTPETTDLKELFDKDGYVILEEVLSDSQCADLFQFILGSFTVTESDHIISPEFRIHCPLMLNALARRSINTIIKPAYSLLDQFLSGEQALVELSSITVFPHAKAQNLHPDESNPGKSIVSVFVNLLPTHAEAGSLWIVPGSHKTYDKEHLISEAIPVELPPGSAVFMNAKTWHCGGENYSKDKIRPVFYFSFGDTQLEGPTYSIREDVTALGLTLTDFKDVSDDQVITSESVPKLRRNTNILRSFSKAENRIYIIQDAQFMGDLVIEEPWIMNLLTMISHPDRDFT